MCRSPTRAWRSVWGGPGQADAREESWGVGILGAIKDQRGRTVADSQQRFTMMLYVGNEILFLAQVWRFLLSKAGRYMYVIFFRV